MANEREQLVYRSGVEFVEASTYMATAIETFMDGSSSDRLDRTNDDTTENLATVPVTAVTIHNPHSRNRGPVVGIGPHGHCPTVIQSRRQSESAILSSVR